MKIILLEDVKNLGKKWEVKNVSDGYARNFLLPKKMAEIANTAALKKIEKLREKDAASHKEELIKIQEVAAHLQGREFVIKAKEKDGKLFGSITAKDIAKELKKENFSLAAGDIELPDPIKEAGEYEVRIKLDHGIETLISVRVEGEQ